MKNARRFVSAPVLWSACFAIAACSSSGNSSGGTGGASSSGGVDGSGGSSSTGGRGTGGASTGSGGTVGTGGSVGSGGGSPNGGATGSGGGTVGNGGRGGAPAGSGGAAGGGSGTSPLMTFFVTSRGPGDGGNLGGLPGADAFCKTLATAVSAALGAKTWHAYLSTSTVNARTRIGEGPWRNAAGVIIANNLTDLHDQLAANAALNATWPVGSTTIALDERGNQVPITGPNVHDILTGSLADGTVAPSTCMDWTSNSMMVTGQVGHTNRAGNGIPSWNSTHATTGCAQPTANMNMPGTVSSGGGRGSLYCFAVP
jgi:Protein of unknown function (DUF1554)